MQMNALRSANFAKLSSNRSTSEAYCVPSMSDGTPAGYCLSQIRSMVSPLHFYVFGIGSRRFGGPALFSAVLAMRQPMASGCALSTHWRFEGKRGQRPPQMPAQLGG